MDLTAALESLLGAESRLDPAAFARQGRAPRAAFAPGSAEEVAELLRACAADGLRVRVWGGGVHAGDAAPDHDVALSTARFDRVVDYEPGDLTCTLGAGLTLASAAAAIAAHGQELPLESARADRATVGGVCAANASGPRRAWLGAPRDRVLGMRFVTGDGVAVRSGGRVVKNVAGHGTHRLLCGSRGSLAVILEASLKLLPAPERRLGLAWAMGSRPPAADRVRAVRDSRIEPAVLAMLDPGAAGDCGLRREWCLVVGLEADAPWAEAQSRIAESLLGPPAATFADADATGLWQRLADLDQGGVAALSVPPSRVTEAISALHAAGAVAAWAHVESGGVRARLAAAGGAAEAYARAARELGLGSQEQPALGRLRARVQEALDPERVLSGGT